MVLQLQRSTFRRLDPRLKENKTGEVLGTWEAA